MAHRLCLVLACIAGLAAAAPFHALNITSITGEGFRPGCVVDFPYVYVYGQTAVHVYNANNPHLPAKLATIATGMSLVTSAAARGGHLYVLGVDLASSPLLQVYDVSNGATPAKLGTDLKLSVRSAEHIALLGSKAYVAANSGIRAVDISVPSKVTLGALHTIPGIARRIAFLGDHAFVADGDASRPLAGLQVLNTGTGVVVNMRTRTTAVMNSVAAGTSNRLFVVDATGLQAVAGANPAVPTIVPGSAVAIAGARNVATEGPYLYVGGPFGVRSYSASVNPVTPLDTTPIIPSQNGPDGVTAASGYLFIQNGKNLYIFRGHGASPPVATPLPRLPNACTSFKVQGFRQTTPSLNQAYAKRAGSPAGGHDTYWSADQQHFFYYCAAGVTHTGGQWRLAAAASYNAVSTALNPVCVSVADRVLHGAAHPATGGAWRQPDASNPSAPQLTPAFACDGAPDITPTPGSPPVTYPVTPPPVGGNAYPSAVPVLPLVSVTGLGVREVARVFTGLTAGVGDVANQSVTVACAAVVASGAVEQVAAVVSGTDVGLRIVTRAYGDAAVLCTFRDQSALQTTQTVTVRVLQDGVRTNTGMYRIGLRTVVSAFRKVTFSSVVTSWLAAAQLGAPVVTVNWVCPELACFNNNLCPVQGQCLVGAAVQGRSAGLLQDAGVIYVDFDVAHNDRARVLAAINARLQGCTTNTTLCPEMQTMRPVHRAVAVNPTGVTGMVPVTTPVTSDDDDDLPGWAIFLIVLGCLVLLGLILCAVCMALGKGKKEGEGEEEPAAEEDGARGAPATAPVEGFHYGEPVSAQYLDGEWYDAMTLEPGAEPLSYDVKWADGSHSQNVPIRQLRRIQEVVEGTPVTGKVDEAQQPGYSPSPRRSRSRRSSRHSVHAMSDASPDDYPQEHHHRSSRSRSSRRRDDSDTEFSSVQRKERDLYSS